MSHWSAPKKKVLFLCTGNSARSQLAEVLLRHKAGSQFDVFSAGTHPQEIDPRTLEVLAQFNLSYAELYSKNVSDFYHDTFDYVITLCDNASAECRDYDNTSQQLAWDFSDPKALPGLHPFLITFNELDSRLSMFIALAVNIKVTPDEKEDSLSQIITINPSTFYKCLTDDIRLKVLMLANFHGELCVCELMQALDEDSQPKVSRNLAVLKKAQIITDRKRGQWVFYRINSALPRWVKTVISETTENNIGLIHSHNQRLSMMRNRPNKANICN